jgi:hypothetical protein
VSDPERELAAMLRTVFIIGLCALLGFFLLGTIFSVFCTAMALAFWLVRLAVKVVIVGAIIYLVIRVVSPETARRLRARFSGPSF